MWAILMEQANTVQSLGVPSRSRRDTLEYLVLLLPELRKMTESFDLEVVESLLEMSGLEARLQLSIEAQSATPERSTKNHTRALEID